MDKKIKDALINPSSAVLLGLMTEMEFDRAEAERLNSLVDNILDRLMQTEEKNERSEFVEVCLRDATASRVLEGIISRLSTVAFSRFRLTYLDRRFGQLSRHPVANFLIAKAIPRLELEQFLSALEECKNKIIDCIDNYRMGVWQSFLERSLTFSESEQEQVNKLILEAFGVQVEIRYAFPCLISLMRLEYFSKTTAYQVLQSAPGNLAMELKLPETNVQGSLLLQGMLRQNVPSQATALIKGLLDLPLGYSLAISRDPVGSRTLDVLLNSPTTPPSCRRQFILRFIGSFHELADDRIGSRIADACWASADVYLKEKIASSLIGLQNVLQKSAYAPYFLKKLELPFFERQRDSWKTSMASKYPTTRAPKPPSIQSTGASPSSGPPRIPIKQADIVVKPHVNRKRGHCDHLVESLSSKVPKFSA